MSKMGFITAIGTPLTDDDQLHLGGLEAHMSDQETAGITSLLVAGSMGAMQMLCDQTWKDLVDQSSALNAGRFEILMGAGDTSYGRTRDRISYLNDCDGIDGVVLLTPYFFGLSQDELVDYFTSLAEHSNKPVYLYDLPALTGLPVEIPTVCKLASHPNIKGIKCSGDFPTTRKLIDAVDDEFRVIVAQPAIMDVILRHREIEQLDGMFAVYPQWVTAMGRAVQADNWQEVTKIQQKMNAVSKAMIDASIFGGFTAIMNAKGILGKFAPRPMSMLDNDKRQALLECDPVKSMLNE
ncbi:MAG: dihydrodipicolinate synthase family protein [Kordiimonadaceae bacterium]|jgi:4-hydroxy-tetrahydrodipicolinate synthase|nr:dihydrodipicolinate synthase family protein [Kordiimonadaceae bacterium]MBT6037434.1 dihydrodipicolinate synthase family protein [Kordiimonadaceae bacterium]MBT6328928.1 dihydrodipicolinate synthase family protein [Kordiimonadaceae bacterium]